MNPVLEPNTLFNPDFSTVELLLKNITHFFVFIYTTYLVEIFAPFLPFIKDAFNLLSVLLIACIVFILFKLNRVIKEENKKYIPIDTKGEEEQKSRIEWEIIQEHLNSKNQAEWKIAIIEADSILDDILKKIGYEGETLAERLKTAGDGDIIQQAWEAHKIRNMIAHEGGTELTQREAKRVVGLYGNVFKKFDYI